MPAYTELTVGQQKNELQGRIQALETAHYKLSIDIELGEVPAIAGVQPVPTPGVLGAVGPGTEVPLSGPEALKEIERQIKVLKKLLKELPKE